MKVTIDIDCTPEEARRFMGLPDVAPLHDAVVAELKGRVDEVMTSMGPERVLKTWLSGPSGEGWQRIQEMFWKAMSDAAKRGGSGSTGGSGGTGGSGKTGGSGGAG